MKIKFYGAAKTVTGSCFMVDTGRRKFLIDCGLFQGGKQLKELNYNPFEFDVSDIDFLLLTHAHIDHSGLIPKLVKHGFRGKVYCTSATLELCSIMLPDSGYIQEMEVERKNRKNLRAGRPLLEPIYTANDAKNALQWFVPVKYEQMIQVAPEVKVTFQNAGHILGAAILEIWVEDQEGKITKLVVSGDLGDLNQPIVNDPAIIEEADYLIMESTYGNRIRQKKESKKEQLLKVILKTKKQGGNLIIPSFAVERTQDLLYFLSMLEHEGKLQDVNIFVDSPLAISATEIFCKATDYYDDDTKKLAESTNDCPFSLPGLKFTKTAEESMQLNKINSGAIIISASGMCEAGRIKHHLKHNLWRKESTILFVGYQAVGTLGRRIINGEKQVKIHGEDIIVKAKIISIEGFSAHADQQTLLGWVKAFKKKPKLIFIIHGEEENINGLAKAIENQLEIPTYIPERLAEVDIIEYESNYVCKEAD